MFFFKWAVSVSKWWGETFAAKVYVELMDYFRTVHFLENKNSPRCNKDFIQCFINTIHFIHYLISHLIIFSTKDKTSFCRLKNDSIWYGPYHRYWRVDNWLEIEAVVAIAIATNILQTFPINFIMSFELISRFNLIWLFLFVIKSDWFYIWSHFCLFSFKLKTLFSPGLRTERGWSHGVRWTLIMKHSCCRHCGTWGSGNSHTLSNCCFIGFDFLYGRSLFRGS